MFVQEPVDAAEHNLQQLAARASSRPELALERRWAALLPSIAGHVISTASPQVWLPGYPHRAAATAAAPLVLKLRWLAGLAAAHMAASSPAPCSPRSLVARKAAVRARASGCTAVLGSTVGQLMAAEAAVPAWGGKS